MIDYEKRKNNTVESILENESLTSYLDDPAADVLIDWGIACAEMVVKNTLQMDDEQAEEYMYARMRTVRRMMRRVNRWIQKRPGLDAEGSQNFLGKVIEQAAIVYGEQFIAPNDMRQKGFIRLHMLMRGNDARMIANLRRMIDPSHHIIRSRGATYGKEGPKKENDQEDSRKAIY